MDLWACGPVGVNCMGILPDQVFCRVKSIIITHVHEFGSMEVYSITIFHIAYDSLILHLTNVSSLNCVFIYAITDNCYEVINVLCKMAVNCTLSILQLS